jgi:uroporphyrinogen decarboxylase
MANRAYKVLPRAEIFKTLERRYPQRVPLFLTKWWGEGLVEQYGERLKAFDHYPEDMFGVWLEPLIQYDKMGLSWEIPQEGGHDARPIVDDWAKLDEFIEKLPDPNNDDRFEEMAAQVREARERDMYVVSGWWRLFFERPWAIRGMQNLLVDYYIAPDNVHRLYQALCDLYIAYLERIAADLQPDGFWTSDDLGHQTQLFMRPTIFREFLKPYYSRIGEFLREHKIHWWIHSCGNNTDILGDLIEVGLDAFHPVQKGTMDEVAVAQEYGDRLTFVAGIDVQHILQEATPQQVRAEVRHLIDTFDREDGGLVLAAGNGIVAGTPIENIEAFLDEALAYGTAHRQRLNQAKGTA